MDKYTSLTLEQIQRLTGHDSIDAVRMALKRAEIKASGLVIGTNAWPPKKAYATDAVWNAFGARILANARTDRDAKEFCWAVFREQVTASTHGQGASEVFSDRLN